MPASVIALGEKFRSAHELWRRCVRGPVYGRDVCRGILESDCTRSSRQDWPAFRPDSQYAEMVRDLRTGIVRHRRTGRCFGSAACRNTAKIRRISPSNGAIDVKINGAMVLLAAVRTRDMEQTVVISMRGGDSDCNPSSAAGVVGTMIGFSKLPAHYTKELSSNRSFPTPPTTCRRCWMFARASGAADGGAAGRTDRA